MLAPEKSKYLIKPTFAATLGGLLFGYDIGVVSGTVSSFKSFFIIKSLSETAANAFKKNLASRALTSCVTKAVINEILSKKSSRKKRLLINHIWEEYLYCYQANYSENEFKYLMHKGFNVKKMYHNYVPTKARGSPVFIVLLLTTGLS